MDTEIIIEAAGGTDAWRYAEVGTEDGLVRLYVESGPDDGAVTLLLTAEDAMALMAALGQAIRAAA